MNQPFSGSLCIQLPRATSLGWSGQIQTAVEQSLAAFADGDGKL